MPPVVGGAVLGAGVASVGVLARAVRCCGAGDVAGFVFRARDSGGAGTRVGRGAASRRGATTAGGAGFDASTAGKTGSGVMTPSDSLTGLEPPPDCAEAGVTIACSAGVGAGRAAK